MTKKVHCNHNHTAILFKDVEIQASFQERSTKGPCVSCLGNPKHHIKSNYQVAFMENCYTNAVASISR